MATNERQQLALDSLTGVVEGIYNQLDGGEIPSMGLPQRSKRNIEFDPHHNVWKYGDLQTARSAKTVNGAVMMLRTVYTADFINEMIRDNKSSTLREMYYISEGWKNAKFHSQDESNLLAEDLETITKCMREDFKLRPEESGAHVYGDGIHVTAVLFVQGQMLDARKGLYGQICFGDVAFVVKVFAHAADGVAAHRALTAVGVEHPHPGIGHVGGQDQNESVSTDSGVSWGHPMGKLRRGQRKRRQSGIYAVKIDIIVARAVHFGEMNEMFHKVVIAEG